MYSVPLEAVYINRFSTTDNGGILFTGNTLGLSKQAGQNQPGVQDAAGAFITINENSQVGLYLPGTTLSWQLNSSYAFLDLPAGSTVLYAELIWAGSYGFEGQITGSEPNIPITLITPQNASFSIAPDPATSQTAITPGYTNAGNYVRSANVTSIVQTGQGGKYTVGGIPATISGLDNSHNAAGWTLAVVYQNPVMLTYNMTIFVGCEQASSALNAPAPVSGFCVPPSGFKLGSLFISAIEGDANITGDHMLFGSTPTLTIVNNSLSGPNNPVNNFFASQINTLSSFSNTVIPSKLVGFSYGTLDRRGSFGNLNSNAQAGITIISGRQGYDITCIDVSDTLAYNQNTAYALGTTTGDDYTINGLGMQILVGSPIITALKTVNGQTTIYAEIGEEVEFTFTFENIGTSPGLNPIFKDILQSGLVYVSGSFTYNGVSIPDPDLTTGFAMLDFSIGDTATITFLATVASYPPTGSIIQNSGIINYDFVPCQGGNINLETATNIVELVLGDEAEPAIEIIKTVNAAQTIISQIGDTITYSFLLTNTGDGDALNVIFKDQIPAGQTLVPHTVLVNGIVVTPDPDISIGIPIGNLLIGSSANIEFQVTLDNPPVIGNLYFDTATVDYQYQPSDGDFVNLTSTSNTVIVELRGAPSCFSGVLKKCNALNKSLFCLNSFWCASDSTNILFYRLYHNNTIVKIIQPNQPLIYKKCFCSKSDAFGFSIATVFPLGIESERTPLRITYE